MLVREGRVDHYWSRVVTYTAPPAEQYWSAH